VRSMILAVMLMTTEVLAAGGGERIREDRSPASAGMEHDRGVGPELEPGMRDFGGKMNPRVERPPVDARPSGPRPGDNMNAKAEKMGSAINREEKDKRQPMERPSRL
jgi:hypothetical protein